MVRVLAIHGRESSPENKLESFEQNRPTARFVSALRFYRMQLHGTHPRSHWLVNHSRTNAEIFEMSKIKEIAVGKQKDIS